MSSGSKGQAPAHAVVYSALSPQFNYNNLLSRSAVARELNAMIKALHNEIKPKPPAFVTMACPPPPASTVSGLAGAISPPLSPSLGRPHGYIFLS